MLTPRSLMSVVGCAAAMSLAAASHAQIKVVYSNIASHPSSVIPNSGGLLFDAGTQTQFDRPYVSPDGNHYLIVASYEAGTSEVDNEIVVTGTFSPFAGNLMVREGTAVPITDGGNYGSFIRTQASINDDGSFAISCDTTAATTADEMIVRYNALTTAWDAPAREGSPHPFVGTGIPSLNWGAVNSDANILADGSIAGRASTFTGTGGTTKQVIYINSTVLGETDVTTPVGQLVAPDQTLDTWTTTDRFRTNSTGTNWIAFGDLNGPTTTDAFIMVNGSIVAQEGAQLPGTSGLANVSVISADAGSNLMSHTGNHWIFRTALADGSGATASDVVVKNGLVVAKTDSPITNQGGETELFDDTPFATTFFSNPVNSNGDYVVGGTTNNINADSNAVLVLNGTRVLVREGDYVDMNDNGIDDDNTYVSVFNNDDCFLTNDRLYFMADLRDGNGAALGAQAFLSIELNPVSGPVCNDIDFNNDGSLFDPQDIDAFLSVYSEGPCIPETATCDDIDFNNDESVFDPCDIDSFLIVFSEGPCTLCGE